MSRAKPYTRYTTLSATAQYASVKITLTKHPGRDTRTKKGIPSSDAALRANQRARHYRLWNDITSNFVDGDHWLCPTYDAMHLPKNEEEAKRNISKFIQDVKRKCKRRGIEVFAIWNTEKGTEGERLHHHIIMNEEVPLHIIEECWTYGKVKPKKLYDEGYNKDGFWTLAGYMIKNSVDSYCRESDLNKQAYSRTRNLKKPRTKKTPVSELEIYVPKGYIVMKNSVKEYTNEITGLPVLEYRLQAATKNPRKNWHRGKKIPFREAYPITREYIEERLSLF